MLPIHWAGGGGSRPPCCYRLKTCSQMVNRQVANRRCAGSRLSFCSCSRRYRRMAFSDATTRQTELEWLNETRSKSSQMRSEASLMRSEARSMRLKARSRARSNQSQTASWLMQAAELRKQNELLANENRQRSSELQRRNELLSSELQRQNEERSSSLLASLMRRKSRKARLQTEAATNIQVVSVAEAPTRALMPLREPRRQIRYGLTREMSAD